MWLCVLLFIRFLFLVERNVFLSTNPHYIGSIARNPFYFIKQLHLVKSASTRYIPSLYLQCSMRTTSFVECSLTNSHCISSHFHHFSTRGMTATRLFVQFSVLVGSVKYFHRQKSNVHVNRFTTKEMEKEKRQVATTNAQQILLYMMESQKKSLRNAFRTIKNWNSFFTLGNIYRQYRNKFKNHKSNETTTQCTEEKKKRERDG